ncbi:ubiquinol oxidase subunit II [Paenibacillus sp. L3-i20]|uniref:ubiquinol oxidase subunit II n=1 Tax=Paenibacillus sp. L3-i20 TaxID=2905833 RepID=UPI001EDDDC42|nr:ubiquinol oxidase subunit II [Paenibacillus sp. L3-i20]GKU79407.1 ubiquinol oxidase subunit 2 [Paenibacillus sp. L3-i20]
MKLSKAYKRLAAVLMFGMLLLITGCTENIVVLNPKGPIAEQQRDLMITSTLLCFIVIIPVLIMTAVIVWRYRDREGRKAKYTPRWEHSTKLEIIWWGIPIIVILVLAVVTVKATYALEPSKPLASEQEPITVQVTSLNWKWLFQYPEQGIATVNELKIPEDVPIRFEITADSPMNSFWIPQLGGQMYAMSGMAMTLYLQADEQGEYWGSGANFTGTHFGDMYFDVEATSREEFDEWVKGIKDESPPLSLEGYKQLAEPATSEVQTFSSFPEGLFEMTVTKYGASHNHGLSWEDAQKFELEETKAGQNK